MSRRPLPEPPPELDPEPEDPVAVCRNLVLRRLARAPQTRQQLLTYLARKGVAEEVAEQVLGRMSEVGLVNDWEFAEMWVRSRRRVRSAGPMALRIELQQRGVARDLIEQAVAERPGDDFELACDLVQRKANALTRLEPAARSRRLVAMLVRRGYDAGTAWRAVSAVVPSLTPEDAEPTA